MAAGMANAFVTELIRCAVHPRVASRIGEAPAVAENVASTDTVRGPGHATPGETSAVSIALFVRWSELSTEKVTRKTPRFARSGTSLVGRERRWRKLVHLLLRQDIRAAESDRSECWQTRLSIPLGVRLLPIHAGASILSSFGVDHAPDPSATARQTRSKFQQSQAHHPTLIGDHLKIRTFPAVVDNFEQVIPAATVSPNVEPALAQDCVTSRSAAHLWRAGVPVTRCPEFRHPRFVPADSRLAGFASMQRTRPRSEICSRLVVCPWRSIGRCAHPRSFLPVLFGPSANPCNS